MTKYILLVSILFVSVASLSAMPARQVQDAANNLVMVGELVIAVLFAQVLHLGKMKSTHLLRT